MKLIEFNCEHSSNIIDMNHLFNECNKLKEIKGINKFNTNNVTNMCAMFQECNELISLDLSNFNTEKKNDMSWMFYDCNNLEDLNINSFKVKCICKIKNIFNNIKKECNIIIKDKKLKDLYSSS